MSDAAAKKSQPPPLRLANLGRSLRRRSREFTRAEQRHHVGDKNITEAYVEACEAELEKAALRFARAAFDCNQFKWPETD